MRVLFVSIRFPGDLRIFVNGVFKRMRMFINAINEISHLDILFYVPPHTDISSPEVSELESSFRKHWNAEISREEHSRGGGRLGGLWHEQTHLDRPGRGVSA